MNTPIPHAIHGKAIDLACEGDRVWFEQNPDRVHRLRDVIPFENNGPLELPPYSMTWKVLVTQIKTGTRFRMLVALPEDLPNDSFNDEHLAEIFKKVAPPEVKSRYGPATSAPPPKSDIWLQRDRLSRRAINKRRTTVQQTAVNRIGTDEL